MAELDTNALVTLEKTKIYLKIELSDHNQLLEILINSVSTDFEGYLERTVRKVAYSDIYLDGNGEEILYLPNWPVDSGETFTVIEDGTTLTEGEDQDFRLYADEGYIVRLGAVWLKGYKTVEIDAYTAGYATIPKDIQLAVMKWIGWEYQQWKQKRWGEVSRQDPEGGSISTYREGELWKEIRRVINKYRRVHI